MSQEMRETAMLEPKKNLRKKTAAELNRERQRRFYERQKEKRRNAPDPVDAICTQTFDQFLELEDWHEVTTSLEWAGIKPCGLPSFDSDDDPGHDPALDGDLPNRGSIGRAERMVGNFLDAATQLASLINRYKREEIDKAIAELQANLLKDAASRSKTIDQIVELRKLRDRLDKKQRHLLPQWETRGG